MDLGKKYERKIALTKKVDFRFLKTFCARIENQRS